MVAHAREIEDGGHLPAMNLKWRVANVYETTLELNSGWRATIMWSSTEDPISFPRLGPNGRPRVVLMRLGAGSPRMIAVTSSTACGGIRESPGGTPRG